MKQWISISVAGALGAAALAVALVRDKPRIGIVDNAVLMQQFSEAIRAREQVQAEKNKWKENLRSLEDSLQSAVAALGSAAGGKDAKKAKEMEERLQKWNREYTRYSEEIQRISPKLEAEKFGPVLEKLNMFVGNWGVEKGFDAIYGTGTGGVILMRNPRFDITSRVLADLNSLYRSEKKVPAADTAQVGQAGTRSPSMASN